MRIRDSIEGLGVAERDALDERLDEAVHEVKGQEAAEINNRGLDAQIEYLGVASACQLHDECFKREPPSMPSRDVFAHLGPQEGEVLEEYLDEAVHEVKGQEAAEINNRGLDAQIEYLDPRVVLGCVREVIDEHGRSEAGRILETRGLNTQQWPGNPVELEHALRRAAFAADAPLELSARGELLDALRAIHAINTPQAGAKCPGIPSQVVGAGSWRGR